MVPFWYWVVSAILLVWNVIGSVACIAQLRMSSERLARLPEAQRDAWRAMPPAAKAAYAIAVGAGLLGAIALLVRSALAGPLFTISLIGVVVQFGWYFLVHRGLARTGPSSALFPAFIALVTVGEIAFAASAGAHGWLS